MSLLRHNRPGRPRGARAFSLAEVAVSVLIVGGLFVAAMNSVGASRTGQFKLDERNRGLLLAQDLMSEILQQAYEDPALPPGSFGRGGAESATGNRSLFNDVDDYHGWTASPPEYKDGSVIPGLDGYGRTVNVRWVGPINLDQVQGSNTGVKRIIVTVQRQSRQVGRLVALRTQAWIEPTLRREGIE